MYRYLLPSHSRDTPCFCFIFSHSLPQPRRLRCSLKIRLLGLIEDGSRPGPGFQCRQEFRAGVAFLIPRGPPPRKENLCLNPGKTLSPAPPAPGPRVAVGGNQNNKKVCCTSRGQRAGWVFSGPPPRLGKTSNSGPRPSRFRLSGPESLHSSRKIQPPPPPHHSMGFFERSWIPVTKHTQNRKKKKPLAEKCRTRAKKRKKKIKFSHLPLPEMAEMPPAFAPPILGRFFYTPWVQSHPGSKDGARRRKRRTEMTRRK